MSESKRIKTTKMHALSKMMFMESLNDDLYISCYLEEKNLSKIRKINKKSSSNKRRVQIKILIRRFPFYVVDTIKTDRKKV